LSIRWKN